MKNQKRKVRTDRPSGRQASEQPEHTQKNPPSASSLHQGQGPDFQTQDPNMQEKNPGITQMRRRTPSDPTSDPDTTRQKTAEKSGPAEQTNPSDIEK
jgi:hypothetical protein